MKLAAVLACRNQSSRLYAKPLQNLNVDRGITILDYLIAQLRLLPEIDEIVLAISENEENITYKRIAQDQGLPYVLGHDSDVLSRLIKGAEYVLADNVLRATTESPYLYLDNLAEIYSSHVEKGMDYSGTQGLPVGTCFEIVSLEALRKSWTDGGDKHRSELCTLYISENRDKFKIALHDVPQELKRLDIRLTVDWPEDLIVMRNIFKDLNLSLEKSHSLAQIIQYLDCNPNIKAINNWIDPGKSRVWY